MLPPEKAAFGVPLPQLNARKERLQPEGNKQVREGQGYEGDRHPDGQKFFAGFLIPCCINN
jgi:hypothetical protein